MKPKTRLLFASGLLSILLLACVDCSKVENTYKDECKSKSTPASTVELPVGTPWATPTISYQPWPEGTVFAPQIWPTPTP